MESANRTAMVVVFDLDDTLYKEADYRDSGFAAVRGALEKLYGKSSISLAAGPPGHIADLQSVCTEFGLPLSMVESLLWIYRLHSPAIRLSPDVSRCLAELGKSHRLAVLTDGRAVSQRQKLKALGLDDLPVYISEECGSAKPDPSRYKRIMDDFPAGSYVYVADNPQKDFVAANALGWKTIGIRGDQRNIHAQDIDGLSSEYLPTVWINSFEELLTLLC